VQWAASEFDDVAIGGDSAGANLSAATGLRARDHGVALTLQVLIYPALDYGAINGPSHDEFEVRHEHFAGIKGYGAGFRRRVQFYWEAYIPDTSRRLEPYASPMRAHSLAGVAPVFLITAEHDILRAEAEDYTRRLADDGVQVGLRNFESQIHGILFSASAH
jgi:acetyl esterase